MDFVWGTTPPPEDRHDWSTPRGNRTYYRRAGVCVTDQWLVITGRAYPIAELHDLRTVRGPHDPLALWATGFAAILAAAAVVISSQDPVSAATAVVLLVAMLPASFAIAAWRMQRRHFELWANFRGAQVRVLRTFDETTYGQITRALIRAREAIESYDRSPFAPMV